MVAVGLDREGDHAVGADGAWEQTVFQADPLLASRATDLGASRAAPPAEVTLPVSLTDRPAWTAADWCERAHRTAEDRGRAAFAATRSCRPATRIGNHHFGEDQRGLSRHCGQRGRSQLTVLSGLLIGRGGCGRDHTAGDDPDRRQGSRGRARPTQDKGWSGYTEESLQHACEVSCRVRAGRLPGRGPMSQVDCPTRTLWSGTPPGIWTAASPRAGGGSARRWRWFPRLLPVTVKLSMEARAGAGRTRREPGRNLAPRGGVAGIFLTHVHRYPLRSPGHSERSIMVGRFRLVLGRPICDYAACAWQDDASITAREVPHRKSAIIDGWRTRLTRARSA